MQYLSHLTQLFRLWLQDVSRRNSVVCSVCLCLASLFIVTLSEQDEPSTLQLLKKHLVLEQTVEDYAETIGLLSQQCRQLLEMGHPDW